MCTQFADDLAAGLVGPIFHREAQKDSITKVGDAQDSTRTGYTIDNVMYFKFTKTPHYSTVGALNDVYTEFRRVLIKSSWPICGAKTLEIGKGNSSESAYYAWAAVNPPATTAAPAAAATAPSPIARSVSSPSVGPPATSARKRAYSEIEADNDALKKENAELKAKLARLRVAIKA